MQRYLSVVHHAAAVAIIAVAAIPCGTAILAAVLSGEGRLERPQLGGQPRGLLLGAQLLVLRVGRPLLRVLRDRHEK